MSTARNILANTFVQVFGKLVTGAFSIVVLKIISGYLGTAGYGDYTTVYQFLALFGIIADFGIYTITVKEMSKDEKSIPMILGNIMGLRTLLVLVAMGLAVAVVFLLPQYGDTLIPTGVLIATMATFFTLLNGTISSVLQTHLKMQYATIGLITGKVVSVAYMAWVAFYLYPKDPILGFYHLLWAGVIGNGAMFALTAYYTRRYTTITYRFDFAFWKKIFLTSLPYGVALTLNTLYFRIDVLLMTILLPHSSAVAVGSCSEKFCADTEIGLYGVAQRMLEVMVIVPVYFMNSVLPVMTRLIQEKSKRIQELMRYSFAFLTATSIPMLVGGFVLATPIVYFISDPQYVSGTAYAYGSDAAIRILMFAMVFSFVNSLFGFTLVVINRQITLMIVNAGVVLFNLTSNILAIPRWGFRGAAVTSVLSELLILIFLYFAVKKSICFDISFRILFKTVFSAIVMGVLLYFGLFWMKDVWFVWQLLTLVPLGMAAYAICMLKTRAVTPEMIALLKKTNTSVPAPLE